MQLPCFLWKSLDSSLGRVTGYGLDAPDSILNMARFNGYRGDFPSGKANWTGS
jgi:hypothetical protein